MNGWMERALFVFLCILIVIGLLVRFASLPFQGMQIDDVFTQLILQPPVSFASLVTDRAIERETLPPLYFLLAAGWQALFGAGETALRALNAVIGALALLAAAIQGRRLLAPRTLLIFLALLACSYGAIYTGYKARPYALLLLFGTILTFAYLGVSRSFRDSGTLSWRPLLQIAAWGVLAAYSHYLGLIFAGAVFALLALQALQQGETRSLGRILSTGLLTLLLFAPWLAYQLPKQLALLGELDYFWFPDSFHEYVFQLHIYLRYISGNMLLSIALFAVFLLPLPFCLRPGRLWEFRGSLTPLAQAVALAAMTLALTIPLNLIAPFSLARYFIVLLPCLYLGMALSFDLLIRLAPRGFWRGGAMLLTAASVSSLLIALPPLFRDTPDDVRAAAIFVTEELGCEEGVLPVFQPRAWSDGLAAYRYYLEPLGEARVESVETAEGDLAFPPGRDPDCRLLLWVHKFYYSVMGETAARLAPDLGIEIDPETFQAAAPVETRIFGSQVIYFRPAE